MAQCFVMHLIMSNGIFCQEMSVFIAQDAGLSHINATIVLSNEGRTDWVVQTFNRTCNQHDNSE